MADHGEADGVCCAQPAVDKVLELVPGFNADMAIILGSGCGGVADAIDNPVSIPYGDLPGFPVSTVVGHDGSLVLGQLNGISVACLKGRVHLYEGTDPQDIRVLIYTLRLLGADKLFLTSAVGSLNMDAGPGELLVLTDHINLMCRNPLIGPNDPIGPRFPSLLNAYDADLRATLKETAAEKGITLHEGVYVATLGPSFETPAEIRAFKVLGADVVGMSCVPEVIVARHCGLKVVATTIVVNYASGMSDKDITHEETLHYTGVAAENVTNLIMGFIDKVKDGAGSD